MYSKKMKDQEIQEKQGNTALIPKSPKGSPIDFSIRVDRSIDRALTDPRSTYRFESTDRSSPKGSLTDFSIRVDRSIDRSSPKGSPIDFSIRVDGSIEP